MSDMKYDLRDLQVVKDLAKKKQLTLAECFQLVHDVLERTGHFNTVQQAIVTYEMDCRDEVVSEDEMDQELLDLFYAFCYIDADGLEFIENNTIRPLKDHKPAKVLSISDGLKFAREVKGNDAKDTDV